MEKKKRTISLIATSVILLGLGVTSCGPDDIGGNGEYNPVNDTFEKELTLDSENVSINGETGLTVEPKNSEDLANAINKLLNDDKLRLTLGLNALKRVEEIFSIDIISKMYEGWLYCEKNCI